MSPDPPPDESADTYGAFVDQLHEHQGILGRICSVYARTPEERDDLRQEILLQAWRSFGTFRGQSAFSTWLYRVALNTALMQRRTRARRREAPLEEDIEAGLTANASAGSTPDVERLQRCLRELPSLDRAIVLLALERQSHEEIAAITGLSRGNIGVRLVRTKERLRRRLLELGHGRTLERGED